MTDDSPKAGVPEYDGDDAEKSGTEDTPVEFKLKLDIDEADTSLTVTVVNEAIIGRRGAGDDEENEALLNIDLTAFDGYKRGISRHHAVLHIQEGKLCLTDLDSHNGTYLNGYHVPARQTALVNDGDEIRLGQVVLHITIESP